MGERDRAESARADEARRLRAANRLLEALGKLRSALKDVETAERRFARATNVAKCATLRRRRSPTKENRLKERRAKQAFQDVATILRNASGYLVARRRWLDALLLREI
jgi:hypothetical protein